MSNGHYLLSPGKPQGNPLVARSRRPSASSTVRATLGLGGGMQARYDAQRITPDNAAHWGNSDMFGPNYSNSQHIRERLRQRSRYEAVENNSYLKGIILTLCNDFVCSGPSIQITDPRLSDSQRRIVELRFNEYAHKIRLRWLLWRLRHAKLVDGEGFAMQYTDRYLDRGFRPGSNMAPREVLTNYTIFEADQCTSTMLDGDTERQVDGIRFDRYMRPTEYFVLHQHPHDMLYGMMSKEEWGRWIRAQYILHWTRSERPWLRGVPETTQALPLCAYLRRYNLAVLDAAETAASFSGVLTSDASADTTNIFGSQARGDTQEIDPVTGEPYIAGYDTDDMEPFPLSRGLFTKLPDGYALSQLDAKQPTERHDQFVDTIIREIARAMGVPFNIAVGFSGGYNFASGTLDRQLYNNTIRREREHCEDYILCSIYESWWEEASRIPGYFSTDTQKTITAQQLMSEVYGEKTQLSQAGAMDRLKKLLASNPLATEILTTPSINAVTGSTTYSIDTEPPKYKWRWDIQPEHADPSKVAEALVTLWDKGFITDDQIQAERFNRDPEEHHVALKKQNMFRKANDLPLPGVTSQAVVGPAPGSNGKAPGSNGKATGATPKPNGTAKPTGGTTKASSGALEATRDRWGVLVGENGYPVDES